MVKECQKNATYKCLPLIILDYITRINNEHYLQTFLEECEYKIKNI